MENVLHAAEPGLPFLEAGVSFRGFEIASQRITSGRRLDIGRPGREGAELDVVVS